MGRKPTKFKPEVTDQQIIDELLAGATGRDLARKYDLTDTAILYRVRRSTGMTVLSLKRSKGWVNQVTPPWMADKVMELYQDEDEWLQPAEIAHRLNIRHSSVMDVLHARGADALAHSRAFSPRVEQEICDRYVAGEDCVALGKDLEVSEKTVRMVLKRHGIQRRARGGRKRVDHEACERAIQLIKDGLTVREASARIGLKASQVHNYMTRKEIAVGHLRGYLYDSRHQPLRLAVTVEQVTELRAQGLKIREISERLGCSRKAVQTRLKRATESPPLPDERDGLDATWKPGT